MLREEQGPTLGSRCLLSRGPDAAISRGADGRVNSLRSCAHPTGDPTHTTIARRDVADNTLRYCRPRLIPREGTTPVAEGAFSTARQSVGPTRPTPPRLEEAGAYAYSPAAPPNQLDFND
jgi:hypothetical protein